MLAKGFNSFYKIENGKALILLMLNTEIIQPTCREAEAFIVMNNYSNETIWKNSACKLYDLGDDVLGLEWYTKMGSIGGEVLEGIQKSIALPKKNIKDWLLPMKAAILVPVQM